MVWRTAHLSLLLVMSGGVEARNHLGENGIVAALTNLVKKKQNNPTLMELGKELAEVMANVVE